MTRSILIKETDGKIDLKLEGDFNFQDLSLVLFSVLSRMADSTIKSIGDNIPKSKDKNRIMKAIKGDIADMINFGASNILNRIAPKDPDLELTEVAIATMENEIIQKAAKEKKTIKQALKEYEAELAKSPYAAKPFRHNNNKEASKDDGVRKED